MRIGDLFNPKGLYFGANVPNWLLRRKEVNGCAKLVWGRLYQYCNDEGRAFPKIETLAEEIGFSVSGTKKAIAELEAFGLIKVEDHFGTHESSDYYFVWHQWIVDGVPTVRRRGPKNEPRASHKSDPAPATKATPRQPQSNSRLPYEIESVEESQGRESEEEETADRPARRSVDADPENPSPRTQSLPTEAPTERITEEDTSPSPPPPRYVGISSDAVSAVQQRLLSAREAEMTGLQKTSASQASKLARRGSTSERRKAKLSEQRDYEQDVGTHEASKGTPLGALSQVWRKEFSCYFPDILQPSRWGGKEYGQTKQLLDRYPQDQVEDLFVFTLRNWKAVQEKLFKGKRPTTAAPSVGFVIQFHEFLAGESAIWSKHRTTLEEYAAYSTDPDEERPADLDRRYVEARRTLLALGF
jgi:Helix-turn-helix domain